MTSHEIQDVLITAAVEGGRITEADAAFLRRFLASQKRGEIPDMREQMQAAKIVAKMTTPVENHTE